MHRNKLLTCTNNSSRVYTAYSKRYFRTVKSRVVAIRPPCAQCTRGECVLISGRFPPFGIRFADLSLSLSFFFALDGVP